MGIFFAGPRATTCISRLPAVFVVSQRHVAPYFENPDRRVRGPEARMCTDDAKAKDFQGFGKKGAERTQADKAKSDSRSVKTKKLPANNSFCTTFGILRTVGNCSRIKRFFTC